MKISFRKMTTDDINSAARSLEVHRRTSGDLEKTIAAHEQIIKDDPNHSFASKVIIEACQRELDSRWSNMSGAS